MLLNPVRLLWRSDLRPHARHARQLTSRGDGWNGGFLCLALTAYDSRRYFALRIENARGKTATLGICFRERAKAFDFKTSLSEHEKYAHICVCS